MAEPGSFSTRVDGEATLVTGVFGGWTQKGFGVLFMCLPVSGNWDVTSDYHFHNDGVGRLNYGYWYEYARYPLYAV